MAVDATKLRRGIRRLGEPPTDSNPELSERRNALDGAGQHRRAVGASCRRRNTRAIATGWFHNTDAAAHGSSTHSSTAPKALPAAPVSALGGARYPDGRSRRRTGRIEQINVKVSAQFNSDLRGLADRHGLLIVEVLERALDAYLRVIAVAETSGRPIDQVLAGLSQN